MDPISYIMIASGVLNLFYPILNFFHSYHALAALCNLENLGNLAFLAILDNFWCKLVILAISKFGRKWLKIDQYWSKKRFFGLFDNFSLFLANPEKKIFFSIFRFFFSAQIQFFQIFDIPFLPKN